MTLILVDDHGHAVVPPAAESDAEGDAVTAILAAGDAVAHRIALRDATQRGRMDEARMRATDLSAQPVDDLHLALGPTLPDGSAWLAMIARERLAARLEQLRQEGVEPQRMVPAVLLLPEPEGKAATVAAHDGLHLLRTRDLGAAMEASLAAMLEAEAGRSDTPAPALAMAMVPALADTAPNFLTGRFAPPRRWWRARWFRWTAGLLVALALVLAVAPMLLARQQTAAAAAGHDAETLAMAGRALGRQFADAPTAATALSAARAGREAGMTSARISALAGAMADVPEARLAALRSDADGHLALTLAGSADAINRLRARLETGAFETGGQGAEVTLGARRGARILAPDAATAALARRLDATRDVMILAAVRAPEGAPPAITAMLERSGLEPDPDAGNGGEILLPAVRPTLLLPLIGEMEAAGMRFAGIAIVANTDATVRATLVAAP